MLKAIFIVGVVFIFILIVMLCVLFKINNRKFNEICEIYRKKYGRLPLGAEKLYNASPYFYTSGYSLKIDFITRPLISNKISTLSDNNEDIVFIRSLDKKLTNTFKFEFYTSVCGVLAFLITFLAAYLDNHF